MAGSATESAVKSLATTRTATPMANMPRIVGLLRRSSVTAIRIPLFVPARVSHKEDDNAISNVTGSRTMSRLVQFTKKPGPATEA